MTQGAVRRTLSVHFRPIVIIAVLSFLLYELAATFLGTGALEATAARVLSSICISLVASCFWINMNMEVLRMVLPRARYAHDTPLRVKHVPACLHSKRDM